MTPTFDIIHFLRIINKTSWHGLLVWCSGHGRFCMGSDTLAVIRCALIERKDCCPHGLSVSGAGRHSAMPVGIPSFCEDIVMQIRPSFPDADTMAFVLSLACLSFDVHSLRLPLVFLIMMPRILSQRKIEVIHIWSHNDVSICCPWPF